jgi:hypothetical protein
MGVSFPTADGWDTGRWCPTGTGDGTHAAAAHSADAGDAAAAVDAADAVLQYVAAMEVRITAKLDAVAAVAGAAAAAAAVEAGAAEPAPDEEVDAVHVHDAGDDTGTHAAAADPHTAAAVLEYLAAREARIMARLDAATAAAAHDTGATGAEEARASGAKEEDEMSEAAAERADAGRAGAPAAIAATAELEEAQESGSERAAPRGGQTPTPPSSTEGEEVTPDQKSLAISIHAL